jgi:hypothetical protein
VDLDAGIGSNHRTALSALEFVDGLGREQVALDRAE